MRWPWWTKTGGGAPGSSPAIQLGASDAAEHEGRANGVSSYTLAVPGSPASIGAGESLIMSVFSDLKHTSQPPSSGGGNGGTVNFEVVDSDGRITGIRIDLGTPDRFTLKGSAGGTLPGSSSHNADVNFSTFFPGGVVPDRVEFVSLGSDNSYGWSDVKEAQLEGGDFAYAFAFFDDYTVSLIPEPTSFVLLATGALLALIRRRRVA